MLLDTSRISEGQLQLNLEDIDLNELLKDWIEEIERTTNHKFMMQTGDVPPIRADGERIGQVVINLLSNAVKYSPKGTTITVNVQREQSGVKISVQDEGYGIPEADVQRIFDRFYRVTVNNMDTYPGMGLELYINAQIVHKHKGTISVQSKEGEGSTFSFTLPYNI